VWYSHRLHDHVPASPVHGTRGRPGPPPGSRPTCSAIGYHDIATPTGLRHPCTPGRTSRRQSLHAFQRRHFTHPDTTSARPTPTPRAVVPASSAGTSVDVIQNSDWPHRRVRLIGHEQRGPVDVAGRHVAWLYRDLMDALASGADNVGGLAVIASEPAGRSAVRGGQPRCGWVARWWHAVPHQKMCSRGGHKSGSCFRQFGPPCAATSQQQPHFRRHWGRAGARFSVVTPDGRLGGHNLGNSVVRDGAPGPGYRYGDSSSGALGVPSSLGPLSVRRRDADYRLTFRCWA